MRLSDRLALPAFGVAATLAHPHAVVRTATRVRHWPHVVLPCCYADRMLWRKLFDRNPLFPVFCDKLEAKAWVAERCPGLGMARTVWVGASAAEIPTELMTRRYVVKASHGCNFNLFFDEDEPGDTGEARRRMARWLNKTFGQANGEWGYRHLRKRVFAEERLGLDGPLPLFDINIRAGNGRFGLGSIIWNAKSKRQKVAYLDEAGRDVSTREPGVVPIVRGDVPDLYFEAVEAARILSVGVDYARFDFLCDGRRLYGGEVTVYPNGGYSMLGGLAEGTAERLMAVWDLRDSWFLANAERHGGWRCWYARRLKRVIDMQAAA